MLVSRVACCSLFVVDFGSYQGFNAVAEATNILMFMQDDVLGEIDVLVFTCSAQPLVS